MTTFYLIDFDRTIYDTIKGADIMIEELSRISEQSAETIRQQLQESDKISVSFAIRDRIVDLVGEELANKVEESFVKRAQSQTMLLEGTNELIDYIRSLGSPFGILTYGSPRGQEMKIRSAGMSEVPHLITDRSHKGALMAEWWQGDHFTLPTELGGGTADQLVLVDDRLLSFDGLPLNALGYWLAPELSVFDTIEHSPQVQTVASLREVIERETKRLTH